MSDHHGNPVKGYIPGAVQVPRVGFTVTSPDAAQPGAVEGLPYAHAVAAGTGFTLAAAGSWRSSSPETVKL